MFKCNGRVKSECKCVQGDPCDCKTEKASKKGKTLICKFCNNEQVVSDIEFGEVIICNNCTHTLSELPI